MQIDDFIKDFREQFIDADEIIIEPETDFRQLESWDSLTGMSILVMIKDIYKVDISDSEFKDCKNPTDLFNLITNKINL